VENEELEEMLEEGNFKIFHQEIVSILLHISTPKQTVSFARSFNSKPQRNLFNYFREQIFETIFFKPLTL